MLLRLVKNAKKTMLYCPNGTVAMATPELLYKIITDFVNPYLFKGSDGFWNTRLKDMENEVGETILFVDNDKHLVIENRDAFVSLLNNISLGPRIVDVNEYSKIVGKSPSSVKNMCVAGKISGAYKMSSGWLIPENSPYPQK